MAGWEGNFSTKVLATGSWNQLLKIHTFKPVTLTALLKMEKIVETFSLTGWFVNWLSGCVEQLTIPDKCSVAHHQVRNLKDIKWIMLNEVGSILGCETPTPHFSESQDKIPATILPKGSKRYLYRFPFCTLTCFTVHLRERRRKKNSTRILAPNLHHVGLVARPIEICSR